MKVFLASQSQGKLKEYRSLLSASGLKLVCPAKSLQVKETGTNFKANAIIKAAAYGRWLQAPVVADDSGLVIEALNGFPGVKTSRFSRNDYPQAMLKIIRRLRAKTNRRAKFVCCLAFYRPGRKIKTFTGEVQGLLSQQPRGKSGFGFDPIFYYPAFKKTFAQVSLSAKNQVSHRSRAVQKLLKFLAAEK